MTAFMATFRSAIVDEMHLAVVVVVQHRPAVPTKESPKVLPRYSGAMLHYYYYYYYRQVHLVDNSTAKSGHKRGPKRFLIKTGEECVCVCVATPFTPPPSPAPPTN